MKNTNPMMTPAALGALARGDLHNAMVAATPGGIEAQEKAGQAMLTLKFNQLPKERLDRYRAHLERIGFKFGTDVDDLFISVTPPAGWELRPSEHSMWSYIHDGQGRKRGAVFYKAAFYDRKASITLDARYQGGGDYRGQDRYSVAKDTATGEVFLEIGPIKEYAEQDAADRKTFDYLDKHFPDWRSVEAYW